MVKHSLILLNGCRFVEIPYIHPEFLEFTPTDLPQIWASSSPSSKKRSSNSSSPSCEDPRPVSDGHPDFRDKGFPGGHFRSISLVGC